MAEPQMLQTDKYGRLMVVLSFHEGARVIHLLENGAYCFDSGLPVQERDDLRKGIPVSHLQDALDWWDHRQDSIDNPPRAIKILPNNTCVFDDGTPVDNIQDIIAYFEPGPFREAALIAFATKLAAQKAAKPGPMDVRPKVAPKKPAAKKKVPAKPPAKAAGAAAAAAPA